jgi:hypothetical protein
VIAPRFIDPPWIDYVSTKPGAIEVAIRAHDDAREGAKRAEEKAARLVSTGIALLTVTLALGAYQLNFILQRPWWTPTIVPVGVALIFLALAVFEAVEIDRVGMYRPALPGDLAGSTGQDAAAALLAREEEGRRFASWTSKRKFSDLMQARAWFSRAIALVILAGVVAATCRAGSTADHSSPKSGTHPATIPARKAR